MYYLVCEKTQKLQHIFVNTKFQINISNVLKMKHSITCLLLCYFGNIANKTKTITIVTHSY